MIYVENPLISYLRVIKVLEMLGYSVKRQSGSHIILEQGGTEKIVVVPRHDTVKRGTLLNIIKQTGLDKDEFLGMV